MDCGYPENVIFKFLPRLSFSNPDIQFEFAVAAVTPSGKRRVYINHITFQRLLPEIQYIIVQHECGHHALDHHRSFIITHEFEMEADCYSAQQAKEVLTEEQWSNVLSFAEKLPPFNVITRDNNGEEVSTIHYRHDVLKHCKNYKGDKSD